MKIFALVAASLAPFSSPTLLAQVLEPGRAPSPWRGPLEVENERPLQSAFLFARPQSPDVLSRGEAKIAAQLDIANNLLIPRTGANGASVEEDFETQRLRLNYARGLRGNLQIEFETKIAARNGGILDGAIDAYHDLLSLPARGRDNPRGRDFYPNGRSVLSFRDASGRGLSEGRAFGLGDSTITLKKPILSGKIPLSARVMAKIPTGSGSQVLGSGGFDAGLAFDARLPIAKRFALNASAGASAWGKSDISNARSSGFSGSLALEYRGNRTSIIAQTLAQTRAVTTGNSFTDRTPVIVSVGIKRDVGKNRMLWASFSENGDYNNFRAPFLGNIGPDYALTIGMSWRR